MSKRVTIEMEKEIAAKRLKRMEEDEEIVKTCYTNLLGQPKTIQVLEDFTRARRLTERRIDWFGKKVKFLDGSLTYLNIHVMQIERLIPLTLCHWFMFCSLLFDSCPCDTILKRITMYELILFYRISKRLVLSELDSRARQRLNIWWAFHELRHVKVEIRRTRKREEMTCVAVMFDTAYDVGTIDQLNIVTNKSSHFINSLKKIYYPTFIKGVHYNNVGGFDNKAKGYRGEIASWLTIDGDVVKRMYKHLNVIDCTLFVLKKVCYVSYARKVLQSKVRSCNIIQKAWRNYMYSLKSTYMQQKSIVYKDIVQNDIVIDNNRVSRTMLLTHPVFGTTIVKSLVADEYNE